jgi:Ribbon-helix-helix protein, copG family
MANAATTFVIGHLAAVCFLSPIKLPKRVLCLAYLSDLSYISGMQAETLSLRISKTEGKALRNRARKDGVSRSSVVRRALRAYGVTPESESVKSGYDVIKHIIGKSRGGPKDLSTNPKHLSDYGK